MKGTSRRKRRGGSDRGFIFDEAEAHRRVEWFPKYLKHTKGEWAGRPFALAPWQRDEIIRPLFGWKRPDGTRRYRIVYVEVPKKTGKSALCAGLALILLCADNEPGAEIYSCAADRDQARIVFDTAKQMAEESPEIAARVSIYRSAIVYRKNNSVYKVVSADAYNKHGFNPHGVIFDELHAHRNRELWDVMKKGRVSRRQPILIAITNSGWDRTSVCWEQHEYAEKVRDGIIPDDSYLPVLYNAPKDCDPYDEKVWAKVIPGLGSIVKIDAIREEAMEARNSPLALNTFRQLFLGQWTESAEHWFDMTKWASCGGSINESDLHGRPCFAGLDLANSTDLGALALLFPPLESGGRWDLLMRFWCPEDGIQRRSKKDRIPYDLWANAGWIKATEGNVIDYDVIRADINDLGVKFDIREIAIDRWNATQITTQLGGDGFVVVPFGQGYASMSAPSKFFEGLYLDEALRHGDNPVMNWMAANAMAQKDAAGNIKPSKEKSGEKIDGIVAAVMAAGRAATEATGSVYDHREIRDLSA